MSLQSMDMERLMAYPDHYWVIRTEDSERFAAKVPVRPGMFGIDHWYHRAKESGNFFLTREEAEECISGIGVLAGGPL